MTPSSFTISASTGRLRPRSALEISGAPTEPYRWPSSSASVPLAPASVRRPGSERDRGLTAGRGRPFHLLGAGLVVRLPARRRPGGRRAVRAGRGAAAHAGAAFAAHAVLARLQEL